MQTLINNVRLQGNLGAAPEVKTTSNGKKMAKFSIAVTENFTNAQGEKTSTTQWLPIIAWGKQADLAEKFLVKGKLVAIDGKLTNRNYTDKNGQKRVITEVVANEIIFLSKNN